MSKIILVGMDSGGLSGDWKAELESCLLIVGGNRHLKACAGTGVRERSITPLGEALAAIRQTLNHGDVGVLASGDPLFFGIGRRLIEEFGPEWVEVRPALSSLQEACACFKVPWDDAAIVSLHGRKFRHLPGELLRNRKTLILTEHENSPDVIAGQVLAYLDLIGAGDMAGEYLLHVAENLGTVKKRLISGSLAEMAGRDFADLNVLLLTGPDLVGREGRFGLKESEIQHSRGLITKDEVRAVTLHKLALPARGVFWDLGAGSGSVALEAARLNPGLVVYAVEKREEEMENIRANIRKFGCFNVIPVQGTTPDVLTELPAPDCIFVGGSGGRLVGILAASAPRLAEGGRLVVNGVIPATVNRAPEILAGHGLTGGLSRVEVRRSAYPDCGETEKCCNPITIITGTKSGNDE